MMDRHLQELLVSITKLAVVALSVKKGMLETINIISSHCAKKQLNFHSGVKDHVTTISPLHPWPQLCSVVQIRYLSLMTTFMTIWTIKMIRVINLRFSSQLSVNLSRTLSLTTAVPIQVLCS